MSSNLLILFVYVRIKWKIYFPVFDCKLNNWLQKGGVVFLPNSKKKYSKISALIRFLATNVYRNEK